MDFSGQVRNSINHNPSIFQGSRNTPPQNNNSFGMLNGPGYPNESGFFGSKLVQLTEAVLMQQRRYKSSFSNPASIVLAEKHQKATKYGYRRFTRPENKEQKKQFKNMEKQLICGCCNFSSHNEEIDVFESVQPSLGETFKLTEDVALYFTFIKSLVVYLILHTLVHSSFNVISSWTTGGYCNKIQTCEKQFWNKTSASNKYDHQDLITVLNILDLVAICLSIVFLGWSRRHFYKVSQKIDMGSVSQADFTLFISNIPRIEYPDQNVNPYEAQSVSREQLKKFLQSFISDGVKNGEITRSIKNTHKSIMSSENIKNSSDYIKSISLCYNLSELEILHDEKWNLIGQFQNNFILIDFCGFKIPDLFGFKIPLNEQGHVNSMRNISDENPPKPQGFNSDIKRRLETNLNKEVDFNLLNLDKKEELNEIRSRVNYICESQISMGNQLVKNKKMFFHNVNFSGNSFVSFEFEDYKEYIHSKFKKNPSQFIFKGVQLKIEDACDPTDVKWYNMKISSGVRSNRILFSYIVLAMLLIFVFSILFSVEVIKHNHIQNEHGGILNFAKAQGFSLVTSLLIMGANALFDYVSWFLTNFEGHQTKTNELFSHMLKSFFSRLINTVFMSFIIAVILSKDFEKQKFMSSTGLVTQIFNLIVVSGSVGLLKMLLNTDDIWARVRRWYIYKYRQQDSDQVFTKFQITLNQEFELPEFNLVYKYNDYLVTLYTALFYSYLVPIAVPTLVLIFSAQYWIDKLTLLKRSSLKSNFSYNLSIYIRKMLESSIIIFALGNTIFSFYLQDYQVSIINFVGLCLAVFYGFCVWIAPAAVQIKLFGEYEAIDPLSYSECADEYRFKATYWNQNPATFCVQENVEMSKSSWSPIKQKGRMSIQRH